MTEWATTRVRVAAVAAVVWVAVLGPGSVWLVHQMRVQVVTTADRLARDRVQEVKLAIEAGAAPGADIIGMPDRDSEHTGWTGPGLELCPWIPPDEGDVETPAFASRVLVEKLRSPHGDELSAEYFKCMYSPWPEPLEVRIAQGTTADGWYFVHVAVAVNPADLAAINTVSLVLWIAVPVTTLLIALVAWLAVGRALRPVAAIRAEVAEISATDLDRRVPVPVARDEIADLADTMNDMLARIATSVQRQRRFTSDASHELRTPLASMRTQLEVLLANPDRLDWQPATANAVMDLQRMQAVVTDLMLLTRVESASLDTEPVDLAALAGLPGPVLVAGNPLHLERVVRNLMDNAERHKASRMEVSLSTEDGFAVLTVADDGPGIPEQDRHRVFERFVRLDEGRARDDGGAGLGLAIAREIVLAHRGTIEVAPSSDGARLVVRLPLAT